MPAILRNRQVVDGYPDNRQGDYWWYSPTAYIVKWSVVIAILVAIFLWFTLGYLHAKRRIRQGKKPLAYHRFLVPQPQRPLMQNNAGYYNRGPDGVHRMQRWQEPPPVYSGEDLPPTYQPPPGASKAAPRQHGPAVPAPVQGTQETGQL